MNNAKNLIHFKLLAYNVHQFIERMRTKWSLLQECKVGLTFKNQVMYFTYYQNKRKKHIIISIDT